jgi:hypothetical protein
MGWFGRKSAAVRPFVPLWLGSNEEAGFVRSVEGLAAFIRSSGVMAVYRAGIWELGTLRGDRVEIAGQQVIGSRGNAIPAPTGGSVIDAQARTSVSAILTALRLHGLIAP